MGRSEKHYDLARRQVCVFFLGGALTTIFKNFLNCVLGDKDQKHIWTTLHYVMGVGGLKNRIALRQHYEGGLVGK